MSNLPRKIMQKYLGRELERLEHVHHIDGNRDNNEISNLMVLEHGDHMALHRIGMPMTAKQKILKYIEGENEPVTTDQIVEGASVNRNTVYFNSTILTKEGAIERYRGIPGLFVPKENEK